MNDKRLKVGEIHNPIQWPTPPKPIESPFNMSAILGSCPELFRVWNQHPFTFDLDDNGRIITRYIHITP